MSINNTDILEHIAETPGMDEETVAEASTTQSAATILRPVSGLYMRSSSSVLPSIESSDQDLMPLLTTDFVEAGTREELRLDIDGSLPQMVASGTIYRALNSRVNWIAKVVAGGNNTWIGTVWFKDGDLGTFPYTNVKIQIVQPNVPDSRKARVIFSGGGAPNAERAYNYVSPYFRKVEFEFDNVQNVNATTSINSHAHPNHPGNLPNEKLTIKKVFQRAGFDVKIAPQGASIPITGANSNGRWSDMEMHDAMQKYWSKFQQKPQWAMWVFHAALHEEGESLGGIMFDDIGNNHRQGTAIFTNSFISTAPTSDPNPEAWVKRMKFWCACHEMGHAFNLAHSWQKALGTPWIPLSNEPEARSFMNYPYNVSGGQTSFFSNFNYRFSNNELLFMRHAPERFVEMGNADWFDHHAFEQANILPEPTLQLELKVQRKTIRGVPAFDFLESVVLELELTNISTRPLVLPSKLLSDTHHLTVIIKRQGREAREMLPFANYCWKPEYRVLDVGASMLESLFVGAGKGGWDIAEPGYYTIQVALHHDNEDVVSNPLVIRVTPPHNYDEELIAQDFFSEEVGRILTFDGSRVLKTGNDTLHEVVDKLPESRAAVHCKVALASSMIHEYKDVEFTETNDNAGYDSNINKTITTERADQDAAASLLSGIFKSAKAAETLGNIDLKYYNKRLGDALQGKYANR